MTLTIGAYQMRNSKLCICVMLSHVADRARHVVWRAYYYDRGIETRKWWVAYVTIY